MDQFHQITEFFTDSSYFYVIAIGMDSRYTYVSRNYNRNFDQSNESLLGKEFSITLHPEDITICASVGMMCFKNPGKLFPATLRKHDGKGGYVTTQWEMKAFFDHNGEPEGIFCTGYNITEYVDTRTKLDEATLEITIKNDQLTEIGFIQSHILRKSLANILGLAEILKSMDVDEHQKTINEMIISSAKELDLVIREISNKTDS